MPRNVAMERLYTWIVGIDLPDNVPVWREKLDVTALWIGRVGYRDAVPVPWPLMENEHVVAMEMHWVRRPSGVVDNYSD